MQTISKQNLSFIMLTAEIISAKLKELGISQAELGKKLGGISGQRIGLYLTGKRKPKQDFIDLWKETFSETKVSRETNTIPFYDAVVVGA